MQVDGQLLTGRVGATDTSAPVSGLGPDRADLRVTLLGATLTHDDQPTATAGRLVFSLAPIRLLVAGTLHAQVSDRTGTRPFLLVPRDRPFLASVPGAVCVLGMLFVAAFLESVLGGVRRRRRARVADTASLAALGALTGGPLVLTAWGAANRLLLPGTVVLVLVAGLAGGVLLSGAADPRRS